MPCYHPIRLKYMYTDDEPLDKKTGLPRFDKETGEVISVKRYLFDDFPGYHISPDSPSYRPNDILVPCRRCIGCRLDYSRRWADRLMLELDHSKTALFFTLTYDDDHITSAPEPDSLGITWYTLVKRDLQLFNKRLRYHFETSHKKIRFFAAGEYGDNTLRPHYHGIYFGLSLSDFPDKKLLSMNVNKQPLYTSEILKSIWQNGNVSIGNVSWQSCAYVARYNLKKLANGDDDLALSRNCLPEFGLMSRRPGIAGYFPVDHPEIFVNPRDKIFISDPHGVRSVTEVNMPSYIFQKLELVNPELYAKIKEERQDSSLHSFLDELDKTDLDEFEYLNLKERLHEKRAKSLVRNL